ncbi:DUF2381 family protein [Myxococcus sp. K15C18031901]|uniref:DUF2381 family protein n=1 Tax=Myxococcus dinghuensis TaxID=2906761 RepID=UPI0020A70E35|nr:DUF2381 family protein [Myxococcus dinghuensis]MCP3097573.1 DUF2381 family protein [Myxococcus dinghuensis]
MSSVLALVWGVMVSLGADVSAPALPSSLPPVRRLEVGTDAKGAPQEVRIAPGRATTFIFDARILPEQLILDGRERFQRLGLSEDHLVLVPSGSFRDGERLRMEVRFQGGGAPERGLFQLVVDLSRSEPQVEVYRRVRPAESYRQEVEELRARLARLESEPRSACPSSASLEDAMDVLVSSVSTADDLSIGKLGGAAAGTHPELAVLSARHLSLKRQWLSVRLMMRAHGDTAGWVATGGTLTSTSGHTLVLMPPRQSSPLRADRDEAVTVMASDLKGAPMGRYVLRLWDARGRAVTLEGVPLY